MVKYLLFRYLRYEPSQPFITLTAVLAFLGVGLGVAVLIVAMAIMNGFDKEFQRKLFVMNYPITIISGFKADFNEADLAALREKFSNISFSPFVSTQIMLQSQSKISGAMLFGVNFEDEAKINPVFAEAISEASQNLKKPNLTAENESFKFGFDKNESEKSEFNIVIGKSNANDFQALGEDKITAVFMQLQAAGFAIIPTMKRYTVKGVFSSGLAAYDRSYTYANLDSVQKVLGYEQGTFDGIHAFSNDPKRDIELLNAHLDFGKRAVGWWEQNGNFFSALALEKRALFIVLMLIILVASLNIISSLLMNVMNRRSEIALLLSLGATQKEVRRSFFAQGLVIGVSGVIFGLGLGLGSYFLLGTFDLVHLPEDVYGSSKLPLELSLLDLASILFGAVVIVFLSSLYPACKAAKINVLETLRNE